MRGWVSRLDVRRVSDAQARDRRAMSELRRDVARLRKVRQTNLVSVIAFDKRESAVVCEAVSGPTLHSLLDAGRGLDLAAACVVYDDCLAGLESLHSAGVVHRDVRPEAIVIESTGVVRLRDAGIPAPPSVEGAALGTPQYMAPEVAAHGRATPAGDVYAATAVFVEAVTGRPLLAAAAAGVSVQQQAHEAMVAASLPVPMQALVVQALAEDPHARRSDIAERRQHLDETARLLAGLDWRRQGRALLATAETARAMPAASAAGGRTRRGHSLSNWQILAIALAGAALFFLAADAVETLVGNRGAGPTRATPTATAARATVSPPLPGAQASSN